MKHLLELKQVLADNLGPAVILEPSRARRPAEIRLLPQSLRLTEIGFHEAEDPNPDDVNAVVGRAYRVDLEIVLSLRLLGGNEEAAFTTQGLYQSIKLAEFFREHFPLTLSEQDDELEPGLSVSGQALVRVGSEPGKAGEFYRLSEEERDGEGRLFLYREDWTLHLTTRAVRLNETPRLKRAEFKTPDGGGFAVTENGREDL